MPSEQHINWNKRSQLQSAKGKPLVSGSDPCAPVGGFLRVCVTRYLYAARFELFQLA